MCPCQFNLQQKDTSTILIVDDNSFNLLTLEMVLKEFCGGIRCDKALNGEEAVKMVSQNLLRAS